MRIFRIVIFVLLTLNVVLFMVNKSLQEALDSLGWLILLATFNYETSALGEGYGSPLERYGLYAAQVLGYGLAIFSCWSYLVSGDTLNLVNSTAWLAVCALLAYDVYAPGEYGGLEWRLRNLAKGALYAVLVVCAALWGWEGIDGGGGFVGMLNFYDATLWIVCFAAVELNVFRYETQAEPEVVAGPMA